MGDDVLVGAGWVAVALLAGDPDEAPPVPMMLGDVFVSLDGLEPVGWEATPVPKAEGEVWLAA